MKEPGHGNVWRGQKRVDSGIEPHQLHERVIVGGLGHQCLPGTASRGGEPQWRGLTQQKKCEERGQVSGQESLQQETGKLNMKPEMQLGHAVKHCGD